MTDQNTKALEELERKLDALLRDMDEAHSSFTARTDAILEEIGNDWNDIAESQETLDRIMEKAADESEAAVAEYAAAAKEQ